jgi:predicted AlkP superfamily phosphohydrolase/phosphomutase/Tfp pilus assembly protein PilF
MFRSKPIRLLLTIGGLVLLSYLLISLFLPSSRRLIYGVDKRTGAVRVAQSRVTFLPPHQFYQLDFERRQGFAQRDGVVTIRSKEQVPVTITYRLRFGISGKLEDTGSLVREGWSAWIRKRVAEAVSAVTAQVPIEELVSPTSQFTARKNLLKDTVARHLARSGLNVTAFEIARIEADREALLRYKRAELRRGARGVAGRVAIFAIDGADWDLINELSNDGRIPNIKALMRGGATASMQTLQPTVSPLLWTSMATGVTPDRHGVLDFIEPTTKLPVDSTSRRLPALWNVSEAFGRHAVVVNWWTAWPPSREATTVFDAPVDLIDNGVYPRELQPRIQPLIVPVETIGYGQVRRFLNITAAEYQTAITQGGPADPVNVFRNVLAKTWSDHRVGLNLYQQQAPLLYMMSFEGTDSVNHLFAPYHPPYREGMSQTNYRKYWPTVANYYSEVDRLIGEWMSVMTQDTTVILVSAHGFRWGKNRPRQQPVGRAALSDHRNPGIFVAYGNHVVPSRAARAMTLYDVAPTVLSILGLPKSAEMPGNVAAWALRDVSPVESVRVVSYSEFFAERPVSGVPRTDPKTFQRELQAIGHMLDPTRSVQPVFEDEDEDGQPDVPQQIPPQQWSSYAYYNNLGIELRRQGKFREAIEAFQKAINLNPTRPTPYLNMSMALADKQQFTAADDVFIQAVQKGLPSADRWFVDFASMYRQRDMPSRAIQLLHKGKQIFPQSPLIAANLGSALAEMSRYSEGLPELERALGLQPSSTLALNNLGVYYARQKDYGRALDFWNRSLTIDGRQPQIRQAADAARAQL